MLKKTILKSVFSAAIAFAGSTAFSCPADDGPQESQIDKLRRHEMNASFVEIYHSIFGACAKQRISDEINKDCTYEGVLVQIPEQSRIQEFITKAKLQPLTSQASLKNAIKEALFTHFAYTDITEEEKELAYPSFVEAITSPTSKDKYPREFKFYRMPKNTFLYPALDGLIFFPINETSAIGEVPRLVIQSGNSFLVVGSDIND